MESEKQMILQKTRTKAFQTDLCFRVSIFIKQKKKTKKTYYDDSWKWDWYAKVKGHTNGIKTHDSSNSRTNAFQKELFASVAIFIEKRKEITKDIIWRLVKMRFIRKRKGKHTWNQTKIVLPKTRTKAFQKDLCFSVSTFIKKRILKRHTMMISENNIYTPT